MSHTKKHRRRHSLKKNKRSSFFKHTLNKGVTNIKRLVKTSSKKYMPKVKTGLENVGSNVINSSKKSIPFFQKMTRKLFYVFELKAKKVK